MPGLFANCVCTMRHSRDLQAAYRNDRRGEFIEHRKWKTVSGWLGDARATGAQVPIVLEERRKMIPV